MRNTTMTSLLRHWRPPAPPYSTTREAGQPWRSRAWGDAELSRHPGLLTTSSAVILATVYTALCWRLLIDSMTTVCIYHCSVRKLTESGSLRIRLVWYAWTNSGNCCSDNTTCCSYVDVWTLIRRRIHRSQFLLFLTSKRIHSTRGINRSLFGF